MKQEIRLSIPKDAISALPLVEFKGEISVIDRPEMVDEAVNNLLKEPILGFDTETRPTFTKGKTHKVALMQISTPDHAYLFRLNKIGMPDALMSLIENPDILKVGLSIKDDFNVMHRSNEFEPQGFVELQQYVKEFGIEDMSLQRVYAIVFNQRISKSQRLTNWEIANLTPGQQTYAAIDAWACLRLYTHLEAGLFNPAECQWQKIDPPAEVSGENTL